MIRNLLQRRPFLVTLPTVGVTVTDRFIAVCVSGPPVRITGVYRSRLDAVACTDRAGAVLAAASAARRLLRVPGGTPAVLALGAGQPTVRLPLVDGWSRRPLPVVADPGAASGLEQAGFVVDRFDALPAALARFAWSSPHDDGHLRAAGWTVEVSTSELRATTGGHGGPSVVPALRGVRIPDAVGRHLRTDVDAGAIGAAIRGFGFHPDVMVDVRSHGPLATTGELAPGST